MRMYFWKFIPAVVILCCGTVPLTSRAQQSGTVAPIATMAAVTTAAPAPVAIPSSRDAILKELAEMKARIAELEAAADADRLRSAEGDAVGDRAQADQPASVPAAVVPAPAPTPAAPEIKAETTTKAAPFPGDWTWLNSGGHNVDSPMSTKYFTPEIRFDANYILDYNHPVDDSMVGSTEMYRSDEFQLEQVSVGGDFRIQNTRGRILYMNGLFSQATVRNDASYNRGQWDLKDAYKYFSEAWGGYHWDVAHGLNVDAGIFVSYIGMFSYYNFDNWSYQPSFVSSNTPWFFNGLRIQYFPSTKVKIEPWIINGWQSYARYNGKPGLGGQIIYRPNPKLHFNFNNYGMGEDDAGFPGRSRVHADYTSQYKFYDNPKKFFDKAAWTMTGDLGCEYGGGPISFATVADTGPGGYGTPGGSLNQKGLSPMKGTSDTYNGGVRCHGSKDGRPKQMFAGWMSYVRLWMDHDRHAITIGGGEMNNPGRYLTLLPSINGSTASTGTPYYTENAGDRAQMHDMTFTYDYMPSQFITFRLEQAYRYSDTPYWTGRGGVTPPGGNNGNPADYQCAAGGDSGAGYVFINPDGNAVAGQPYAIKQCETLGLNAGGSGVNALWWPDLRTNQSTTMGSIMVRF